MGYPGRQNIYDAAIRRMVLESLDRQEQEFRLAHESDTDEQLLCYLRSWANRLHHSPWPGEITGGSLILERFGSWSQALALAKLHPPRMENQPQNFARYRRETEVQKEVYRQRKAERKLLAEQRRISQEAKKKQSE